MRYLILLIGLILVIRNSATTQILEGNWKGTSTCQIKNSSCHDETVIYHISKNKENNSYKVTASKIIDGIENNMGILIFTYDPNQSILYLIDNDKQIKWKFKVTGNEMHGSLTSNGKLFRIVDLKKEG